MRTHTIVEAGGGRFMVLVNGFRWGPARAMIAGSPDVSYATRAEAATAFADAEAAMAHYVAALRAKARP